MPDGRIAELLDVDEVVTIVRELAPLPASPGAERARADRLGALLAPRARAVGMALCIDVFDEGRRANVLLGPQDGADVAFVGHLDASLGDDPQDWLRLTGRDDDPGPVVVRDGVLEGPGIGVALAPSVAAALTAIELHRRRAASGRAGTIGALITSGGTHRARPPAPGGSTLEPSSAAAGTASAAGLREAERRGRLPRAAINAKGGAPGPLHVEPGSLYLAVELTSAWGPVLLRPPGDDLAGGPADLAIVIGALAGWRRRFIAERHADDVLAADVALGAVEAGVPAKPDLMPASTRLHVHVVTAPGDDPAAIAMWLERSLRAALPPAAGEVVVRHYGWLPAGRTERDHPLVRAADAAWRTLIGPHDVRGWRGATDGAFLRHLGVPTVRVGPPLSSDPADPRRERVRLDDLRSIAEVWSQTVSTYLDAEVTP